MYRRRGTRLKASSRPMTPAPNCHAVAATQASLSLSGDDARIWTSAHNSAVRQLIGLASNLLKNSVAGNGSRFRRNSATHTMEMTIFSRLPFSNSRVAGPLLRSCNSPA